MNKLNWKKKKKVLALSLYTLSLLSGLQRTLYEPQHHKPAHSTLDELMVQTQL